MSMTERILVADDNETFLRSTTEMLRREGYECDCSSNAETAIRMMRTSRYDLLIADIHMPGNSDLELVKKIPKIAQGMPTILVTGNASVDTATQSIHLSVVAYMTKPFDPDKLLMHVRNSIKQYKTYCSVESSSQRLLEWQKDLMSIKQLLSGASESAVSLPINAFFKLTFQNIAGSLLDLEHLVEGIDQESGEQHVCNLLECPSLTKMKTGLMETMEVLRKTRESFKSKELAKLRDKLDTIVKSVK